MPVFVVRIDKEDETADFKVFSRRGDAEKRFGAASVHVWRGEFPSVAWFEVATEDNREAVAAIKRGDKTLSRLIDKEPRDLNLDLSGILDDIKPKTS